MTKLQDGSLIIAESTLGKVEIAMLAMVVDSEHGAEFETGKPILAVAPICVSSESDWHTEVVSRWLRYNIRTSEILEIL